MSSPAHTTIENIEPVQADNIPGAPIDSYTLANGLKVIFHIDRRLPMVHVNSWYHAGAKHEPDGRTGLAHFVEHMMFNGSKHAAGKFMDFVQQAGANLAEGGVNGTTNHDRTNYFESVPPQNLEHILWLESDRLATLPEVLTVQRLETEREIIKNERRQRIEGRPYGRAETLMVQNVFRAPHPYSHDVLGNPDDLMAIDVGDMTEFFNTYYTPNNLSLVIAGDFDPAKAKHWIEKYYGPIPPGPTLGYVKKWIPRLAEEKIIEVMDRVPYARIYLAWPSPAYFDAGDSALDLTAYILTSGLSSRLLMDIIHERQFCSDVIAFQNSMESAGTFGIWATARPGHSLHEVEKIIVEHIAFLADQGPTEEELCRAKEKWELRYMRRLERLGGFGGKADLFNTYNTFLGSPDKRAADIERYRAITANDIRHAVGRWIDTPNRVQLRFYPEKSTRNHGITVDRAIAPAVSNPERFAAPKIECAKLDNGMDILVVEQKDLFTVAGLLVARCGSVDDPRGKEGLANLHMHTIKCGTCTKDTLEIDRLLGSLGTALDLGTNAESSHAGFNVVRRNLDAGLAALADIACRPSFPRTDVANEIGYQLDRLEQAKKEPWSIAMRISTMLGFGAEHPYGHPSNGFPSTVRTITRDDLASLHERRWSPSRSALILVGNISLSEATSLAGKNFGSWRGDRTVEPEIPLPQPAAPGKAYMVDWPEASQTVIAGILPGAARTSQDFYPLSLANLVWGAPASGRLGRKLRYEKGYSYSIRSFGVVYAKHGILKAVCRVQTNKTRESIEEFQRELAFMAGEKPITEQELIDAKHERIRGYVQRFEGPEQIARQIAGLWTARLPMSEIDREWHQMESTSLESVNACARKYASPDKAAFLLVGDRSKIEAGMQQLPFQETVILDDEGKQIL